MHADRTRHVSGRQHIFQTQGEMQQGSSMQSPVRPCWSHVRMQSGGAVPTARPAEQEGNELLALAAGQQSLECERARGTQGSQLF